MPNKALRCLFPLLLCLLVLGLPFSGAAEEAEDAAQPVTGYFTERKSVREKPEASRPAGSVEAFTVVTLTPVQNGWYAYALSEDRTGYIFANDLVPEPVPEACDPWPGYCAGDVSVRCLPLFRGKSVATVPAETIFTVDGSYAEYLHVTLADGTTGYIDASLVLSADFTPKPVPPFALYVTAETAVTDTPLSTASVIGTLLPYVTYDVTGTWGDCYTVDMNGVTGYLPVSAADTVSRTETLSLALVPAGTAQYAAPGGGEDSPVEAPLLLTVAETVTEDNGDWLLLEETGLYVRAAEVSRLEADPLPGVTLYAPAEEPLRLWPDERVESTGTLSAGTLVRQRYCVGTWRLLPAETGWALLNAEGSAVTVASLGSFTAANAALWVTADTAVLLTEDGESVTLSRGDTVYLTGESDTVYHVRRGSVTGFMTAASLAPVTADTAAERLAGADLSGATVTRSALMDSAFSMLDAANAFLTRYNAITGAGVDAVLPMGVPYFWGGRSYRTVTERLPLYSTRMAWQSSPGYYVKGSAYVAGFDCVGFIRSAYSLSGAPFSGTLSELREDAYCRAGQHVWCSERHPLPDSWEEVAASLTPGDLIMVDHPGFHVMMYIGTLRSFGYTAEQLPALGAWLDMPLVIHCGGNPYYHDAFEQLIEAGDDSRLSNALPPDGGVAIAILGVPKGHEDYTVQDCGNTYRCFDIEGTCVTLFDFSQVSAYTFWHR